MQRIDFYSSQEDSQVEQKIEQNLAQDNQNLLSMSGFQSEIIQKYNPYVKVFVSGPKWSKEGGVGQYRLYKIETKMNHQTEMFAVYRRFRDFDWLYQILQLKYPACIIPPIPPKNAMVNWYADESEQIQSRKAGLERFLSKAMSHRIMCESDDLKGFLIEADHTFEDRKKQSQTFIAENSDQSQSYSSIALNAVSSVFNFTAHLIQVFSKASSKLSGYVWTNNSPKPSIRKQSFGQQNPEAQLELDRFLNNEEYLETLKESFHSLSQEILTLIDCTEESSKNYSSLSENFSSFTNQNSKRLNMKGANIDQLYVLSKDISQTFQLTSNQMKDVLEEQVQKLKEPIDDYRLMIDAALDACLRRRQLVFRYYEMVEQQQKSQQMVHEDHTGQLRTQYQQLTKKIEETFEKVTESKKTLEVELKLFRQQKEVELKNLISEFVRIQKISNERMKHHWQTFLAKSEVVAKDSASIQSQYNDKY